MYTEEKNGENLQEGYSEEDWQQVLADDPYYIEVTEARDRAIEAYVKSINETIGAPF